MMIIIKDDLMCSAKNVNHLYVSKTVFRGVSIEKLNLKQSDFRWGTTL